MQDAVSRLEEYLLVIGCFQGCLLFLPWLGCYLLTDDILICDPGGMVRWISGALAHSWRLLASEYLEFAQAFAFAGVTIRMIWRYRRYAQKTFMSSSTATVSRWFATASPEAVMTRY